ncbi:hypothetical protein GJ744_002772 [Endocarpon pusillum]|uniref:Uncharacterized protein n=1 Tax=Endocarpon pusillum TaxID=364733 RepID=A0A8H7AR75_9EURO|nr:hypothetical protein GJ744_002772 [Endocarpon pusillum]
MPGDIVKIRHELKLSLMLGHAVLRGHIKWLRRQAHVIRLTDSVWLFWSTDEGSFAAVKIAGDGRAQAAVDPAD